MRFIVAAAVALAAGCNPAAVNPTFAGVQSLGYACGEGVEDGEPSGLYQWHCTGTVDGHLAVIDVDGNANGTSGFTLSINAADPGIIRGEYRRVVTSVSPLTAEPDLAAALDSWTGRQESQIVGAARVNGACDATQCNIDITSVAGPLQPLHLP
jgi:hypothetical protein